MLAARLADAARALDIVLTGAGVQLPASIGIAAARLRLPAPDADEFRQLLARVLADVASRMHVDVEMPAREQEHLLASLRGLTLMEAEKLLTRAIVEDGRLASADIQKVLDAKRRVVEEEGLLEYYPVSTGMDDIADLAGLKQWLAQRRAIIAETLLAEARRTRPLAVTMTERVQSLRQWASGRTRSASDAA